MTVVLFSGAALGGPLGISTPIPVSVGGLITANADGPADLLGTLTATIQDPQGNIIVAASAVTVTLDSDLGNGLWRYVARAAAPTIPGAYQIVWAGPDPTQTATEPITVELGARPGLSEVAALLRARTKVQGGKELGTFTSATRPTDVEVEDLIDMASDEVLGKVQPIDSSLPSGSSYNAPGSDYERRIRRAITLYTAILIETSYWPEQVRNNQSPVATYQQLYDSRIRALISEGEVGRAGGMGEGAGGAGDAPADAAWTFPDAMPGALVGWASRW